jgi:hypothetical protein
MTAVAARRRHKMLSYAPLLRSMKLLCKRINHPQLQATISHV